MGEARGVRPQAVRRSVAVPVFAVAARTVQRVTAERLAVVTVWVARLAWLLAAVIGGSAIGTALADASRPVQVVGTIGAWVGFAAGAVALLVPGVISLTAVRAIVPGSLAVCIATVIAGADAGAVVALLLPAVVATAAVATAEFGMHFVQASAYGAERRFGLRPPLGYLIAVAVSWLLTVAALIVAPLALAAAAWLPGVAGLLVAVVGLLAGPRRWHQLTRRWLVLVPAGAVVHDPVVLAETLMAQRHVLAGARLVADRADASPDAVDLSGPTPGPAVEVRVSQTLPAILYTPTGQGRTELAAVDAYLIVPTRPGAALRALGAAP